MNKSDLDNKFNVVVMLKITCGFPPCGLSKDDLSFLKPLASMSSKVLFF